jgi:MoxR-like ATPase
MSDWKIFQGDNCPPHDGIEALPDPPSWRKFSGDGKKTQEKKRGATFQARPGEVELVNAALYLRRPLLVTGKPGTGKTSLAHAVAYQLKLGEVLYWPITTRTTLKDGLYSYDAIARLQDTPQQGSNIQVQTIQIVQIIKINSRKLVNISNLGHWALLYYHRIDLGRY